MEEKKPNENLRRKRELRGWSQRKLAELVGTDEQVVNRWESGPHALVYLRQSPNYLGKALQMYNDAATIVTQAMPHVRAYVFSSLAEAICKERRQRRMLSSIRLGRV
jgi:transcriptional regulator with XRE-family HTH domain